MLKISVQKLGDTSVLRCRGRIAAGDASSILRNAVLSQRYTMAASVQAPLRRTSLALSYRAWRDC
jgi:hypothetical protein